MTDTKTTFEICPFETLGKANHGWLDAHHHFSFGSYHDDTRMSWGAIRVWNDDLIAPQSGFPPHPNADMEIITYVRTGAITHKDSLSHEGRTAAGDVQVMSAMLNLIRRMRQRRFSRFGLCQIGQADPLVGVRSPSPKVTVRVRGKFYLADLMRTVMPCPSAPMPACLARRLRQARALNIPSAQTAMPIWCQPPALLKLTAGAQMPAMAWRSVKA
jgi:hypothetical protein